MSASRIFFVLVRAITLFIGLTFILIGLFSFAGISVPLESVRQQFVKKATEVSGHEIRVDGEVRLDVTRLLFFHANGAIAVLENPRGL